MPQAARWAGTPSIKGRSESTRMALLTFSLVGLQCVLPEEKTQRRKTLAEDELEEET
jgi:solute carrier family 45 protein 1/2/4